MIAAVILSGGESSRMGSPKALLPLDGQSFIERIVAVLQASRVGTILAVLGHHANEIKPRIQHLPVAVVINPDYRQGQLSSLVAAIRFLETKKKKEPIDGLMVHLVDHPFLSTALVDEMIECFYKSDKLIVVPCYRGKRGHPVLFSRKLWPELLNAPLEQGAKRVVHAHRNETLEIATEEKGILLDIDTPEEYRTNFGVRP